jgi:hypothetical protein
MELGDLQVEDAAEELLGLEVEDVDVDQPLGEGLEGEDQGDDREVPPG